MVIYFPTEAEALATNLILVPGLRDPQSSDFARKACRLDQYRDAWFQITTKGICVNRLDIAKGVVERLIATDGLRHVFQPCALPPRRWDHVRLTELALSPGWQAYAEALRKEYSNGFVEVRSYQVAEGVVEDAVLRSKPYLQMSGHRVEILRHPKIQADFGIAEMDAQRLSLPGSWRQYSPFLFGGVLAETLVFGGAYSPYEHNAERISRALQLADAVFAGHDRNYASLQFHACAVPWCRLIYDVAWDHTWLILEPHLRRLTVFLASDTD